VVNLADAKFECIYGRGCDGICCQNGRPPISAEDDKRIRKSLKKARPLLRPEARALLDREGFVSRRRKWSQLGPEPLPMLRVVGGWCIFFNEGCVLHKLGAAEGDRYRYKPVLCALFPLEKDSSGEWYVRQKGFRGEKWDLFCLDPKASPRLAAESLEEELEVARRFDAQQAKAEKKAAKQASAKPAKDGTD
jgi:Fe-S-cluster containining protein